MIYTNLKTNFIYHVLYLPMFGIHLLSHLNVFFCGGSSFFRLVMVVGTTEVVRRGSVVVGRSLHWNLVTVIISNDI